MNFKNLGDMLIQNAKKLKSKKYIFFEDKKYTYAEVNKITNKVAHALTNLGLKKGDRVAILLDNSPEFLFSFFGITKCGAVAVPINNFLKQEEIGYILNDCQVKYLITSENYQDFFPYLKENVSSLNATLTYNFLSPHSVNFSELINNEPDNDPPCDFEMDDLAVLIYTSGTTGHPKGAMLTHKNLLSNCDACNKAFKVKKSDRFLLFLPMFHSYAFTTCVLLPTFLGCSIIILRSVMELRSKKFKNVLLFKRPTFFLGVPQVYSALSKAKLPKWFIKFLYPVRIHVSGGAPLPEEILNVFKEKFKRPIIEGYGLSEASPVVAVNRLEWQKPYSVGLPLPDVEVKIVNDDEEELPVGEIGELIVKGPNVMKGYWNLPEATEQAIRNGWLFTGDMAKIDEDGFIYIVDRKKDLIIVKGINVYPREIEELLYQYPGVEAAAVIGVPDEASGEVPVAYVMPKENESLNEKDIKNYLKSHLANFKVPKKIHIVDELPMTATGKVLKRKLKEQVLQSTE
ncbi:long-chain fatty-acid-CoA ligase [Deferribacter desulfuricans SSM1]|uniref:Long-chain-fatty-acid--CoA ligase n=1 Tax=Deferribacter desulfuricans (strain DSM 14783 / JCM 11476 / NBRC 101012 / SSM1) TaxID=639282 RepID=D3PBZ9_DEFDS|nr:fatty acid--CoA ligase [Deferribacter desulfuricans]BAI80122.1 long-chain fatty-acid-CoA ligase [Deferribacter desulfuricans SSM1]